MRVVHCLVEGVSVRATERLTGIHRDTVLSVLRIMGEKCVRLLTEKISNVHPSAVQVDEIFGFCLKKEKNKTAEEADNLKIGDAYTFVGLEAQSKLVLCFELGRRDSQTTFRFLDKLRQATQGRFQLTSDGFRPYVDGVDYVFGSAIDYAQLVKIYNSDESTRERYSPGEVVAATPVRIMGNPDVRRISTSFVESHNLTMRTHLRRLTRLTNGYSKKWENLYAALALYFCYYNFCWIHSTLRCTPAMEAGITDHIWSLGELVGYNTN